MKQFSQLPFFPNFNFRNQVINENCTKLKDITELPSETHYETAICYLSEKQIHEGIKKRMDDIFCRPNRSNFLVTGSTDSFKKNQIQTKYSFLHQLNNFIEKDYKSATLNCGLNLMDVGFLGNVGTPRTVVDTDLKVYWKFNEASGDIINVSESAADLGSAADLQVTGATHGATGIIGDALSFDAVNDKAVAGTSTSQFNFFHQSTALFTIVMWVKTNNAPTNSENLMTTRPGGATTGILYTFETTRRLSFIIKTGSVNPIDFLSSNNFLSNDNAFHMLLAEYEDGRAGDDFGYSEDNGAPETQNRLVASTGGDHNVALHIGERSIGDFDLDAIVDETSIWNRLLTNQEKSNIFNGGNGLEL